MSQRVLVVGDYRQTVVVVRSLARAGYEVTLGCPFPESSTARSRYVARVWNYDGSSTERFLGDLAAFIEAERPDYTFVVGERPLRRLIHAAPRFEGLTLWAHPGAEALARCFDKAALYELAPRLGIPTVPWVPFTSAPEWRLRAAEIGFPVIVKRKDSSARVLGRKALICGSPSELEAFLASLERDPNPAQLVMQKYFIGVRHNCHVASAGGKLVLYFQQRVLRTDALDDTGIGTAGVSVAPSPELRAYCERLASALDYTGIGCIQFLVNEATGEVAFLEFNARMDSTAALPYRLGLDFPRIALDLARCRRFGHRPPREVARPYAVGCTYHWLLGDVRSWFNAARARRLSAFALARWAAWTAWMSLRSHHLTFDWRDPLPTLHMYWSALGKPVLRRLRLLAGGSARRVPAK